MFVMNHSTVPSTYTVCSSRSFASSGYGPQLRFCYVKRRVCDLCGTCSVSSFRRSERLPFSTAPNIFYLSLSFRATKFTYCRSASSRSSSPVPHSTFSRRNLVTLQSRISSTSDTLCSLLSFRRSAQILLTYSFTVSRSSPHVPRWILFFVVLHATSSLVCRVSHSFPRLSSTVISLHFVFVADSSLLSLGFLPGCPASAFLRSPSAPHSRCHTRSTRRRLTSSRLITYIESLLSLLRRSSNTCETSSDCSCSAQSIRFRFPRSLFPCRSPGGLFSLKGAPRFHTLLCRWHPADRFVITASTFDLSSWHFRVQSLPSSSSPVAVADCSVHDHVINRSNLSIVSLTCLPRVSRITYVGLRVTLFFGHVRYRRVRGGSVSQPSSSDYPVNTSDVTSFTVLPRRLPCHTVTVPGHLLHCSALSAIVVPSSLRGDISSLLESRGEILISPIGTSGFLPSCWDNYVSSVPGCPRARVASRVSCPWWSPHTTSRHHVSQALAPPRFGHADDCSSWSSVDFLVSKSHLCWLRRCSTTPRYRQRRSCPRRPRC